MVERGLLFGSVAEAYERYRLGYPEEVIDLVLGYAQPPVETAIEIGAGTGKATRPLAARGIQITAVEPDPGMARVLAHHTSDLPVTIRPVTYEQLSLDQEYDLLLAAASFHWTAPATRWDRATALVRPGGTLAFFGAGGTVPTRIADPDLQAAVDDARSSVMTGSDRIVNDPSATSGLHWPVAEIEHDPRFTAIEEHEVPRSLDRSRDDFLGYLSTVSAYLQLSLEDRAEVFRRIERVLPPRFAVASDLRIHLARRTLRQTQGTSASSVGG